MAIILLHDISVMRQHSVEMVSRTLPAQDTSTTENVHFFPAVTGLWWTRKLAEKQLCGSWSKRHLNNSIALSFAVLMMRMNRICENVVRVLSIDVLELHEGRYVLLVLIEQRCTTFFYQWPICSIFSAFEGQRQNYQPNSESRVWKPDFFYLTISFLLLVVWYCFHQSCFGL